MTDTQSPAVTPEGCVYVTETFAAMLALHNAGQFACDYVGNTEMAKQYGRLRMFLLRRAGDGKGPPVLGDIERAASWWRPLVDATTLRVSRDSGTVAADSRAPLAAKVLFEEVVRAPWGGAGTKQLPLRTGH